MQGDGTPVTQYQIDKNIHHYVTADGRRFASALCAAHSVIHADENTMVPVIDERGQFEYTLSDCNRLWYMRERGDEFSGPSAAAVLGHQRGRF